MSSLLRRRARKHARLNGSWKERERPYREVKGKDGYETLHPTKGWKYVSPRRLGAQNRLRWMIETGNWIFGRVNIR